MATVKSYELAAYLTMVHDAISKKARDIFTETATSSPAPQLISGYTPMKGKVDQAEVIALAVVLAELFTKAENRTLLTDADRFVYGSSVKSLSDAIDNVREALQSQVAYDNSLKATLDFLENTNAIKSATDSLTTKMKADLQAPNHWAVAVLDVLLVTGLQSVPLVGNILSTVVKGGIVSATTSCLGGMAANQTQALRSTNNDVQSAQKGTGGLNPFNEMGGGVYGYSFGQKTSGTYKGNTIQNDLGGQAAQGLANQASSQMQTLVNAGAYDKDKAKDNIASQWYSTGINATFFYTMVKQSKQDNEKTELKVLADDAEFLREFAGRDTNRWLAMSQNPQTANQLVASFSNRGASNGKVKDAARLVGAEFEKTLNQDKKTLDNFAKSVAGKLKQFRKLVDEFLSMSVALALSDSIEKFKTQAAGKGIDPQKFGTLKKSAEISSHDENICALLILSYYFIKDIKHKVRLMDELRALNGSEPYINAIEGQMRAVVQRREDYQRTAALAQIPDRIKQAQANFERARTDFQEMANKAGVEDTQLDRGRFVVKAQQANLERLRETMKSQNDAIQRAVSDFPTLQGSRLKTFQVQNDPSAAANKLKMEGLGSSANFSWSPITTASKNYVDQLKRATMQDIQAIFPSPAESGFEEAMKAVLACTVIISQVHAQSARGQDIEISYGAVSALTDPKLDFVYLYTKIFGIATSKDKMNALVQDVGGVASYRLRWPKDTKMTGSASIAETSTMYVFAATVVAYVDLAEIARGTITWGVYKKFLNLVVREINEKAISLKNENSALYKEELKRAEKSFKDNKDALSQKLKLAKEQEKIKAEEQKKKDKEKTKAAQAALVGKRKI